MVIDISSVDLTGQDPNFKRSDMRYMIFKTGQTLYFKEPIYAESVAMWKVTEAGNTPLVEGTDFSVPSSGSLIAEDAISEAKIMTSRSGETFSKVLVTGVNMLGVFSEEYQVLVQGQAFYKQASDYVGSGSGPDYSRPLMKSVIERIKYLEEIKNPIESIVTTDVENIKPLDEDLTAAATTNFIKNEEHSVDVPNNIYAIRPIYGTFYDTTDLVVSFEGTENRIVQETDIDKYIYLPDSQTNVLLTLANISTYLGTSQLFVIDSGTALTKDEDYIIRGTDLIRTRIANVKYGVYDRIILTKKFKGIAKITYHAFGGEVTLKDIYALKQSVISLYAQLENGNYLTEDAVKTMPLITSMISRIDHLDDVCHTADPFQFRYRYSFDTEGKAQDLWVNVAELYNDSWTSLSEVPNDYVEEFCLKNETLNYCAYFGIRYNLKNNKVTIENARVAAVNPEAKGVDYFTLRKTAKFRVIYDENNLTQGILLQMSIISGETGEGAWQIKAVNASESQWVVIDTNGGYKEDATETCVLPGGMVWRVADHNATNIAVLSNPYTLFFGSLPLSLLDSVSYREGTIYYNVKEGTSNDDEPGKVELEGINLPILTDVNAFDIQSVKGFRFHVYDRYIGKMIVRTTENIHVSSSDTVSGDVIYFPMDLCDIEGILKYSNGSFSVHVKSHTGMNSLENERFDFRQIDLIFQEGEV